jgi:two-component system, cell cycle sensor histidine kinase and response regulator CckA
MTYNGLVKILLVEDNRSDSVLVKEWLRLSSLNEDNSRFSVKHVTSLSSALCILEESSFDIVLYDLSLPDSVGLEGFYEIQTKHNNLPIIVLTGRNDLDLAFQALREGAQDYLCKNDITEKLLVRSILYAVERNRAELALTGYSEILEMLAKNNPLEEILIKLAETVEQQSTGMICSILLYDDEHKCLHNIAAPSLHNDYLKEVDGIRVGPSMGSCGTAAFTKSRVVASDIKSDPRWSQFKNLALKYNLRACWSQPILSSKRELLGTFAIYYNEPRCATKAEEKFIEKWTNLAGIAIERKKTENELIASQLKIKDSESKLRLTLENAPIGIASCDKEGYFLSANQALCEILGYSQNELLEMKMFDLTHPDDISITQETRAQLIKGEIERYHLEKRYITKNREERSVSVTVCAVRDTNGELIQTVSEIEDLTEKKKWEAEFLKASKLESLGILAGGIAHDFNNILTSILGSLSLAKAELKIGADIFQRIVDVENASQRAKKLTKQLLTFSKGGTPIKEVINLTNLIKEYVSFSTNGSNCAVELYIADNLWNVEVDETQIGQVIHNLTINALQAMPKGGTLKVKCKNTVFSETNKTANFSFESGRYVQISVIDEGQGIPKENLSKIFDPYFTTKEQGSGLGLATSYSIVKKHKGHIEVESEMNSGSSFTIFLPATEKVSQKIEPIKHQIAEGHGKILIMDDEPTVRETAGDILKFLGYQVDYAADGSQALQLHEKAKAVGKPFDIIIMDLTIRGGMGGRDAIEKLRGIDSEVKTIVSSGYSDDPIMSNFDKFGFDGVVAKPYEINSLSSLLSRLMSAEENKN